MLFGVITCVGCVYYVQVRVEPPPKGGRVTPETCRDIDS
jgi:hypothetical protein